MDGICPIARVGYKEFHPFLEALEAHPTASLAALTPPLQSTLQQCVEKLKQATRRYAKQQYVWVKRFTATSAIPVYQIEQTSDAVQIARGTVALSLSWRMTLLLWW